MGFGFLVNAKVSGHAVCCTSQRANVGELTELLSVFIPLLSETPVQKAISNILDFVPQSRLRTFFNHPAFATPLVEKEGSGDAIKM